MWLLLRYGLDVGMYGRAGAKTTAQLLKELQGGECRLAVRPHANASRVQL